MARMRRLLSYALGIVGFIFLSLILEEGLIDNMYVKMAGITNPSSYNVEISDVNARATNVNGYMNFKLTSKEAVTDKYLKIELFSKTGLEAGTKYVAIEDLGANSSKNYQVKFHAVEARNYKVSVIDASEVPDKSNIINILGWEFDLSNVFGMDLTNVRLFGHKLSEIFNVDYIKSTGASLYVWAMRFISGIPWWGYAIGAGIILWYMPKGYLFGIFPF